MKEEDKILDAFHENDKNNAKRNSCLLITAVALVVLIAFAYVASKEVSESNEALKNALLKTSQHKPIVERIDSVSNSFNSLIDSTINQLIVQTGGWKEGTNDTEFANPKNYEIPTRIMISEKVGDRIERMIGQTNLSYKQVLKEELEIDTIELPFKLNYNFKEKHDKTWSEMNFDHMPLFALMPLLRKFKKDESESKAIIYRHVANQ